MATTMVSGIRTTDLVSSSLIKREVYDEIFDFKPFQTPLTQWFMANKRNKIAVGNPKYEAQEDILVPASTTVATVTGGGATETLTVATSTGVYFKAGDVVRISTPTSAGENVRVTSVGASTVVVASLDGSANIGAYTGATLTLASYAFAEGSASAVALSTQSTFPYNYTEILKRAVHLSGTQMASVNYGGSDWTHQRVKATEEFKLAIERMSLFGVRNINTASGANIRYSGGLLDTTSGAMGITDSTQFVGNNFATEAEFFETYALNLFAKGSNEKLLICGAGALIGINNFSSIKQQTRVADKEYGYDVTTILTPFGRAKLMWHPMLTGNFSNWVIGVDRDDYMKYAYLSGNGVNRDMKYEDNIGTPGTDERKAQYIAEIGMWLAGGSQGVHRVLYPGASA